MDQAMLVNLLVYNMFRALEMCDKDAHYHTLRTQAYNYLVRVGMINVDDEE